MERRSTSGALLAVDALEAAVLGRLLARERMSARIPSSELLLELVWGGWCGSKGGFENAYRCECSSTEAKSDGGEHKDGAQGDDVEPAGRVREWACAWWSYTTALPLAKCVTSVHRQ